MTAVQCYFPFSITFPDYYCSLGDPTTERTTLWVLVSVDQGDIWRLDSRQYPMETSGGGVTVTIFHFLLTTSDFLYTTSWLQLLTSLITHFLLFLTTRVTLSKLLLEVPKLSSLGVVLPSDFCHCLPKTSNFLPLIVLTISTSELPFSSLLSYPLHSE